MADQMVPIRSVKQYLNEFIYEGIIQKGQDTGLIREQLLDAFQKEVFGQIFFRYGDPALLSRDVDHVPEETRIGCRNILDQANRKWRRLCIEVGRYPKTRNMIDVSDLNERLKDIVEIQENEQKD